MPPSRRLCEPDLPSHSHGWSIPTRPTDQQDDGGRLTEHCRPRFPRMVLPKGFLRRGRAPGGIKPEGATGSVSGLRRGASLPNTDSAVLAALEADARAEVHFAPLARSGGGGWCSSVPRPDVQPLRPRRRRLVRNGTGRRPQPSRGARPVSGLGSRFSLIRSHEVGLAVVRCLWHAHRRGVLHRDIKPTNVLLPSSEQPAAKLGDFGIARLADAGSSSPRNVVMGTPRFASPEALAGGSGGAAHDVYGLGVTPYTRLKGGRPPCELKGTETLAELRHLQTTTRPPWIRSLVAEVEADVDDRRAATMASGSTRGSAICLI